MKYLPIILLTLFGGYLRFYDLGYYALWVDEALFGLWVRNDYPLQEFVPVYLGKILNLNTEFGLRSLSAFFGTLTIPAMYYVVSRRKIEASLLVAVFPLFVFWSRMARPYAVAGFFLVLGWRYYWFYIPAILTTPISLIGIKIIKQKKAVIVSALAAAVMFYLIREDSDRGWTINQVLQSSRWFYLPALTFLLYLYDYFMLKLDDRLIRQ